MLRHTLIHHFEYLPKFLQCIPWGHIEYRLETYRLLKIWSKPKNLIDAIELLDIKYMDITIRDYAISILNMLTDDELKLYLLQLIQCLKYECYHHSTLSKFLITRALQSPLQIGHHLFW
jgi:phosphatidylinositol-4,5-bisphosphate 3-kinase